MARVIVNPRELFDHLRHPRKRPVLRGITRSESPPEQHLFDYVDRESHYVWGKRYLLTVAESDEPPSIELKQSRMLLRVRPRTNEGKRQALVEEWYREQIKKTVPPLIAEWESRVGVKVERFFVQQMKTRWGSCNYKAHTIRLNTELAKKPRKCLEYVVVHEMVHLLEPTYNARFTGLLDRLAVRHEHWGY